MFNALLKWSYTARTSLYTCSSDGSTCMLEEKEEEAFVRGIKKKKLIGGFKRGADLIHVKED